MVALRITRILRAQMFRVLFVSLFLLYGCTARAGLTRVNIPAQFGDAQESHGGQLKLATEAGGYMLPPVGGAVIHPESLLDILTILRITDNHNHLHIDHVKVSSYAFLFGAGYGVQGTTITINGEMRP